MFNSFSLSLNSLFIISYILLFVKYFFKFFLKLFYLTKNLFWRFSFSNFCIISYRLTFVKNFFNFFEILFSQVVRFWPSATFISYHRFKCLSRTFLSFFEKTFWTSFFRSSVLFCQQLLHLTIDEVVCQELFLFFLKTFLSFCRLRQRQVI